MFQPLEGGRQAWPQRPVHPALLHPHSPDVSQPSGTLHSWLLNILMTPVCSFFSWFKAVVLEGMGFPVWLSGKDSTCQRQETRVPSLGREDSLEKEMAAHSVLLPGKCHGQRSLAGHSSWGHRVGHN